MTKFRDNGGSAFPSSKDTWNHTQGMTLLDYYAGKALEGLIKDKDALYALNGGSESSTRENIADACFGIADAMIKARAKWTT